MDIFAKLDSFFSNHTHSIDEELIDPKNSYIVKLLAARYIIHPQYIKEVNQYLNDYNFYALDTKTFLLFCKKVIFDFKIEINKWKPFIKKPKLDQPANDQVYKEFKQNFPRRMNEAYSDQDIMFYYQILDEHEIAQFSPTLRKKLGTRKRVTKKEREVLHKKFEEKQKLVSCDFIEQNEKFNKIVLDKVANPCKTCALKNNQAVGNDLILNKNQCEIDIMFVGMNPYKDEIKAGKPFVGKSGQYLREKLNEYFSDMNYVITNSVMCFIPDNGDPTPDDIHHCSAFLEFQVEMFKPKYIVALGALAIQATTELENFAIKDVRLKTYEFKYDHKYRVIPTSHPSGIIRSKEQREPAFIEDLKYIRNLIVDNTIQESVIKTKKNTTPIQNNINLDSLRNLTSWDEVKSLIQNGYLLSDAQTFQWTRYEKYVDETGKEKTNYITDKVLSVAVFLDPNTKEPLYFNLNNLPYEYFVSLKKVEEGIKPLEEISKCKKESITFEQFLTNRYEYQKVSKFRLFEGDIDASNKFTNECKILAKQLGIETKTNTIFHIDNIGYLDIEVDSSEGFVKPEVATSQVIMFAYSDTNMDEILVVTHKEYAKDLQPFDHTEERLKKYIPEETWEKLKDEKYRIILVENEQELFTYLENLIKDRKPQVLTSWNAWYDFNYLYNRSVLKNYGLTLSPLGIEGYISHRTGLYKAPGVAILDKLEIYKSTLRKQLPSYKLGKIAEKELGYSKVEYEGDINILFQDPEKATLYNMIDVLLIKHLDKEKSLFSSKFTVRSMQGSALESLLDTVVPFTNILIQYARESNLCIRSKLGLSKKTDEFGGAFTRAFFKGVFPLVVDYDQSVPGFAIIPVIRNNELIFMRIDEYMYKLGDKTFSLDDNQNLCIKPIEGLLKHKLKDRILKITLEDGTVLYVTEGHSVYVKEGDSIVIKEAKNLTADDILINIQKDELCVL